MIDENSDNQMHISVFAKHLFFEHMISLHPNPSVFDFHAHSRFELFFCNKGKGTYTVEENTYPLKNGELIVIRPGEYHGPSIDSSAEYDRYYIHFSPDVIRQIDPEMLLIRPFTNRSFGSDNLYDSNNIDVELIQRCLLKMNEAEKDKSINIQCYFYPILQQIYSAYSLSHASNEIAITDNIDKNVYEIIDFINRNLNEELSLELIEKHFFINRNSLTRDFKKVTGKTIWNYILDKRLFAANQMLEAGEQATKAAFACGFKDYSSFYRAYKTKYRMSPKNAGL